MGMFRKAASIGTVGMINFNSTKEKNAKSNRMEAEAAKELAAAQAELAKAQADMVRMQQAQVADQTAQLRLAEAEALRARHSGAAEQQ